MSACQNGDMVIIPRYMRGMCKVGISRSCLYDRCMTGTVKGM